MTVLVAAVRRAAALAGAGLLLAGAAACAAPDAVRQPGQAPPSPVPPSPAVTTAHGPAGDDTAPPPFLVRYGTAELRLTPHTYCLTDPLAGSGWIGCADGSDADPVPLGSPQEVFVLVPVAGMDRLVVTQVGDGAPCAGCRVQAEVTSLGDGWWQVRPQGPAGDYDVEIFAYGEEAGDLVANVRWSRLPGESAPGAGG
ncbi:hypothetical protein DNL40_04805 [Xylanimonas oleitrophica]|uniref:Lipoprotein n=1 Tax=Xylanimonas oleitrophica TaxID=2607479 RepID=A0A2W5XV19_9MICO|nr:hypothetical protein [Xylanimonas oleitrophica]PZR54238.1 hypothetical protein DNL40_04805 [Xylanimonas oleitrophica]